MLEAWKVPDAPPVGWGGLPPPPPAPDQEPESIAWEELPSTGSSGMWPRIPAPAPLPSEPLPLPAAASASTTSPSPSAVPPPPSWRHTGPVPGRPAMPGMPATPDFAGILAASGRDQIFEAAMAALGRRFARTAIFVVRPEGVAGWSASGVGVDVAAVRRLTLPWSEPSIFLNVRMSRSFYLGPLPPLARHDEFAAAVGGWPAECLVQPVLMKDKTVAFLYAECRGEQGATPVELTYVRELAGATAAALAASIRLKKKQVI